MREPDDASAGGFRDVFFEQFGRTVALATLLGCDDPEDCAQAAFAKLYSSWSGLRDTDAAAGHVRRTVVNQSRNGRRHRAVMRRHFHDAAQVPAGPMPSAESEVVDQEQAGAVAAALGRLSARRRAAVVLRYWLDLPYSDIADTVGCPAATVGSDVHRGLPELAEVLTQGGDTP